MAWGVVVMRETGGEAGEVRKKEQKEKEGGGVSCF